MKPDFRTFLFSFLLVVNLLCPITSIAQTRARIENVGFILDSNQIKIFYTLVNSKPYESFNITPKIYKVSGQQINARTFTGDLKNVTGNALHIINWDIEKDGIALDNEIYVEITAELETSQKKEKLLNPPSKAICLLNSVVYPGWGSARLSNNNWHYVKGVLAYGTLVSAIVFHQLAETNYDNYITANDYSTRNEYYNNVGKYTTLFYIFLSGAVAIWSVDIFTVMVSKGDHDMKISGILFPSDNLSINTNQLTLISCIIKF